MRVALLLSVLFLSSSHLCAQQSDYFILKKKNGRVLKTYFQGAFLSAETFNGMRLHGYIQAVQNDSIILIQEETRLIPTAFGQAMDTLRYKYGLYYTQIKRFHYKDQFRFSGRKGFRVVSIPLLMKVTGTGLVLLELVNTLYREESITSNNKIPFLAASAGLAITGWLWDRIERKRDQVGKKYSVVYVRAKSGQLP